jgi:hypothetical protein
VLDRFSLFFSSNRFLSLLSYKGASLFILMILFVFSVSVFSDLGYIQAHRSTVCNRQTFSLVNCPGSLSSDGDIDRNYGGENIEQQIPLVIPFP